MKTIGFKRICLNLKIFFGVTKSIENRLDLPLSLRFAMKTIEQSIASGNLIERLNFFVKVLFSHFYRSRFLKHIGRDTNRRSGRLTDLIEPPLELLQPFAGEEQESFNFVREIHGQVKTNENQVQIEHTQIEPEAEQVEQTKDELAEGLLVGGVHDLLQEDQAECEFRSRILMYSGVQIFIS